MVERSDSVSFYLRDPNSGSPRAKHLAAVEREEVAVVELEYLGLYIRQRSSVFGILKTFYMIFVCPEF